MTRPLRILVAGVGNVFLGDDGFGVAVADRLALDPPAGVRVEDFGIRGVHLAYELMNGYDVLILVDAMARGAAPGTVSVVEPDLDAIEPSSGVEAHAMNPDQVLACCKGLGVRLNRVLVVGCEPEDCSYRWGLTDRIAASVDAGASTVRELVAGLVETWQKPAGRA
ncbi:hydrogenase maturation protease [Saccharopolyspora sp. WRP15-2]|uniref:Hydrogenase maturation protease n=1 Tax=Saccharopolyspora oryzae TaxID=2997343 RepID=A0ABT4UU32_9PSEU|nr:hydrogenase maturation protease [Saccharopolyspora oryzae]MDA3625220.1 hydrogenase maturation protease [Saccharopolyspora oryzae]